MRALWFGRSLYDEIYTLENLTRAWRKVRAARGGPGSDGISIVAFETDWTANLTQLARDLAQERYVPAPPRRYTLPKPDGGARGVAVLAVRDRLAQRAVQNVIEPLFEARFLPCSYGYRPGRNTAQAAEAVLQARAAGYTWVVDADIATFFDSLDQQLLLEEVARVVEDRKVLRLLRLWLEAGLLDPAPQAAVQHRSRGPVVRDHLVSEFDQLVDWGLRQLSGEGEDPFEPGGPARHGDRRREALRRTASGLAMLALSSRAALHGHLRGLGRVARPVVAATIGSVAIGAAALAAPALGRRPNEATRSLGVLQGGVISPLLANAYLHPLDVALSQHYPHLIRYADDLLILCRTEDDAREALVCLRETLAKLRLGLREEKTSIHRVDTPFVFLGYRFADGRAVAPEATAQQVAGRIRTLGATGAHAAQRQAGVGLDRLRMAAGARAEMLGRTAQDRGQHLLRRPATSRRRAR